MEELINQLALMFPQVEYEIEKSWVWITSDLAPHANKCSCKQCQERAVIRKGIHALGFMYAKKGHTLPSGARSYWGHHCEKPTRFARHKSSEPKNNKPQPIQEDAMADDALLELVGG